VPKEGSGSTFPLLGIGSRWRPVILDHSGQHPPDSRRADLAHFRRNPATATRRTRVNRGEWAPAAGRMSAQLSAAFLSNRLNA